MIRLLLPILALLLVIWFFQSYRKGDLAKRKKLVLGFLFAVLFGFVIFLTVTGRLHFIAAIVTGLLPFVKKLFPILRYIPVLRRLIKGAKDGTQKEESASRPASNASNSAMSKLQAYSVLGLADGASEEEVVDAHRKLMQKLHPDRGGNDYLAAQLNQAKEILLADMPDDRDV